MPASGLKITIDIFSGRKNPEVTNPQTKLKSALTKLSMDSRAPNVFGAPSFPTLGYRGLVVEHDGREIPNMPKSFRILDGVAFGPGFAVRFDSGQFEDDICGSIPLLKEVPRTVFDAERLIRDPFVKFDPSSFVLTPRPRGCACGPLYEPGWWNVAPRQGANNCYNYSCNYRSDSFAQPGQAAGSMYTALTCASVHPAALADCLIDSPGADNRCPAEGHLVALVIAPGWDFHWYRKDRNGYWSHKPGSTPVTNLDNSGHLISDPRTADRGPYSQFCGFLTVMHGHIKIQ